MHRFECNIKPRGDVPTLTPCSGLDGHSAPLCSRAFIAPRRAIAGLYGHLVVLAMMVVKLNGDGGASEQAGAPPVWPYLTSASLARFAAWCFSRTNQFQRREKNLTLAFYCMLFKNGVVCFHMSYLYLQVGIILFVKIGASRIDFAWKFLLMKWQNQQSSFFESITENKSCKSFSELPICKKWC